MEFREQLLVQPPLRMEREILALKAAQQYERETEEFDQKVCSRRDADGVAMPENGYQFSLINKNAIAVRNRILQENGLTYDEFQIALRALRSDVRRRR